MKIYILLIVSVIWFSCSTKNESFVVKNIGELRDIMHKGLIQARVSLDTLNDSNLFGLGAMDSLSGEVLVLSNRVFASKIIDSAVQISNNENVKATLFIYASINEWDTLNVFDVNDLELLLKEKSMTLNLETAFPFILIGKPQTLAYHIINFNTATGDLNNHKEDAFKGELTNELVTILGFYATNAQGIYTHHDSNVHMHFLNSEFNNSGHVDDVDFTNRAFKLLIPKS